MKKSFYWNNVWNDFRQSKWIKLGWLISGAAGSLVAWYLTADGESVINWGNAYTVLKMIFGWYVLVLLYILGKNLVHYIHNTFVDSLYGDVISNLTQLNLQLKEVMRDGEIDDARLMRLLKKICNDLKRFFDNKTHAICGVSIKVTLSKDKDIASWKFRNLCRDDKSTNRDTEEYNRTDHTVVGNTPYQHVINQMIRHSSKVAYINNNIPEAKDYLNTSKIREDMILPYKSELVYPIMPLKQVQGDPEMCGFLCVDCDKIERFDEKRYDVPVLESIIDNLYELLTRIIDSPKNEK